MSEPRHHKDHLVLIRLLRNANWPVHSFSYRIADGNNAYAALKISGKELRLELVPDRTDCFVITKYDGQPLPEDHPLYMTNPPFEAASVAFADLGDADPAD